MSKLSEQKILTYDISLTGYSTNFMFVTLSRQAFSFVKGWAGSTTVIIPTSLACWTDTRQKPALMSRTEDFLLMKASIDSAQPHTRLSSFCLSDSVRRHIFSANDLQTNSVVLYLASWLGLDLPDCLHLERLPVMAHTFPHDQ